MTFIVQDKSNYYLYNDNHYCLFELKKIVLQIGVPKNLLKTSLK